MSSILVDDTRLTMIDLNKKIMKGMMCLRAKLISASYSLTSKFNIENLCKMKDNYAFEDKLNVIVVKTENDSNNDIVKSGGVKN